MASKEGETAVKWEIQHFTLDYRQIGETEARHQALHDADLFWPALQRAHQLSTRRDPSVSQANIQQSEFEKWNIAKIGSSVSDSNANFLFTCLACHSNHRHQSQRNAKRLVNN